MIVIVVGMHRSGTSALAGLLHKNHIIMGEEENFVPKPSTENVKGFYENYLFRRMNDSIVERCGYKIKSWDVCVPPISASIIIRHKMRRLLQRYNNMYEKWGWKDPRTCLTLDIWLNELRKLKFINNCKLLYIVREPYAVAKSMSVRKDTTHKNALKLWQVYNEYALRAIDLYNVDTFYLSYEQLCKNPVLLSQYIFEFVEHDFDIDVVNQFIDVELNRSAIDIDECDIGDKLSDEINNVKERIFSRIKLLP